MAKFILTEGTTSYAFWHLLKCIKQFLPHFNFVHLFMQIFTEYFLCARHYFRYWRWNRDKIVSAHLWLIPLIEEDM